MLPSPTQAMVCSAKRPHMFFQGEDVGHDLAGMGLVGEAIDHRNRRVFRQFQEVFMVLGADHDGIHKARENLRRIGNGFAAPQLHVARGNQQGLAAKLPDANLKGNPGAG